MKIFFKDSLEDNLIIADIFTAVLGTDDAGRNILTFSVSEETDDVYATEIDVYIGSESEGEQILEELYANDKVNLTKFPAFYNANEEEIKAYLVKNCIV